MFQRIAHFEKKYKVFENNKIFGLGTCWNKTALIGIPTILDLVRNMGSGWGRKDKKCLKPPPRLGITMVYWWFWTMWRTSIPTVHSLVARKPIDYRGSSNKHIPQKVSFKMAFLALDGCQEKANSSHTHALVWTSSPKMHPRSQQKLSLSTGSS